MNLLTETYSPDDFSRGVQTTDYTLIYEDEVWPKGTNRRRQLKYRVLIHTDGYANQAFAKVQLWADGWNTIHAIDGYEMREMGVNLDFGYKRDAGRLMHQAVIQPVVDMLQRVAKEVTT